MKPKTRKILNIEVNSRLVELFSAFLVIFIIILIIAPIVYNIIQNVRKNTYQINEQLMIVATKHYVVLYSDEIKLDLGESSAVDLTMLVDKSLMEPLYAAGTKDICIGNVIVSKSFEDEVTYRAYLLCGDYETER